MAAYIIAAQSQHSSRSRNGFEPVLRESAELLKWGMMGSLNGSAWAILTLGIVFIYAGKWGKGLEEKAKRKLFRLGVGFLVGGIVIVIVQLLLRRAGS
jgi:hypothetical protein